MHLIPVDSAPYQEMTIAFKAHSLRLTLRHNSLADYWAMDVFDLKQDLYTAQGLPLVVGVPLLWRRPVEYCFILTDESGIGLDPVGGEDLGQRCLLYIADKTQIPL
ncbi:Uncharacterized protein MCB1EB_1566 [Mycoavidus cysteinexigens]|uniref:Cyanophage baseplate Pam3 plug gp18 domain-containing protein n=1 Tax=Mycoavidus cysteinexigens TaxID=1553431 RepID=A0A2Z6EW96_9BURK|nr:hypothetical protein [Mycoavidus cysteinexigens]BBE09727.1 Uncharacterized protein MCB1EB_1566 [Mycoavidus cysteinexigens]GAM51549.1 hypothetical protein EBME_0012 [bacterium endosymbiont of Mortierella elongata FMR23-6]GLR01402.1 hypothetical protein GCM10007934_12140 [Mycoavidus cysteinexigens]